MTVLGQIQGYDVIYNPEEDTVFCKNTTVSFSTLDKAVVSTRIIEKIANLTITKENKIISLGCLVTDKNTYNRFKRKLLKIKDEHRKENH